MASRVSYYHHLAVPSVVLSDGIVPVPLWPVTTMTLADTYHLPPHSWPDSMAVVATHDDTITIAGVLVGPERFAWKHALETLAEASTRGSALAAFAGGKVGGLILVTSMTIRTDMQVQSLSFTASSAKRDAIDVSITL